MESHSNEHEVKAF